MGQNSLINLSKTYAQEGNRSPNALQSHDLVSNHPRESESTREKGLEKYRTENNRSYTSRCLEMSPIEPSSPQSPRELCDNVEEEGCRSRSISPKNVQKPDAVESIIPRTNHGDSTTSYLIKSLIAIVENSESKKRIDDDKKLVGDEEIVTVGEKLIYHLAGIALPHTREFPTEGNFTSYLSQLRGLLMDQSNEENRKLLAAVKDAISDIRIA